MAGGKQEMVNGSAQALSNEFIKLVVRARLVRHLFEWVL